jgi:serine/threonine-protein kinase
MVPEHMGPYKIEKLIGQGGMGSVYKAHHIKSGLPVAIKVISNSIADESRFRRRFQVEIETLKRLKHPNIVQLIGYGEEGGNLFYSMEYVEGESLHECLRRNGPIPWDDVLRFGIDICSALKHAHDFGIIHRDLKPANLLVSAEGTVKLVDFGIAKLFGAAEMTMAGSIVGTADFMAPEQADGKTATTRSDLYSLGSVLYAALTGRAPFAGKSVPETLYALKFTDPIPLRRIAKDTPLEFAELIEQLLAKDPGTRPPTALVVNNRMKAMQQGLKKRTETIEIEKVGGMDTHTSLDLNEFQERLIDLPTGTSDRITIEARDQTKILPADPTLLARPQTVPAAEGNVSQDFVVAQNTSSPATNVTGASTHFTTVDGKSPVTSSFSDESHTSNHSQQLFSVGAIAIALIACLVAVWYLTRPPSANDLYASFASALETNNLDMLTVSYDSLIEFQQRFPEDERAELVRGAIEEVEASRKLRSLIRKSRRESLSLDKSMMEESIFQAIQLSELEPEKALRQLQAIGAVYGKKKDLSPSQQELLEIVDRKRELLTKAILANNSDAQKELKTLVEWGLANLTGKERTNFLNGLVELYAEKPWAETEVRRAQEILSSQEP